MSKKKEEEKNSNNKNSKKRKNTKKNTSKNVKEKKEIKVEKVILTEDKEEEYYDILGKESNHFFTKLLIVLLLLLSFSFIVYHFVIQDNKSIFSSGINTIYEKLANNIVKISNNQLFNEKYKLSGVLTLNTTDKTYQNLNNYNYDIDFNIDKLNHNYGLNLKVKNDNSEIINTNYIYSNNNYYLNIDNIFENTIMLENNILDYDNIDLLFSNIDFNKLNISAKRIKNILNSNIQREKLEKNMEDENTVIVYSLSSEEYSEVLSKIIDDIKNDTKLLNNLATSFKLNESDIIKYLDNILKKNLVNDFQNIKFKFYTKGYLFKVIGFKIEIDNNTLLSYFNEDEVKLNLNYKDYSINFYKSNNFIDLSKSMEKKDSKNMVRVRDHKQNGTDIHLFMRKNKDDEGSNEFYYLGKMDFESFVNDETPVKIRYKLREEVRFDLFEYFVR